MVSCPTAWGSGRAEFRKDAPWGRSDWFVMAGTPRSASQKRTTTMGGEFPVELDFLMRVTCPSRS
jgi:hypothetical protein